MIAKRLLLFPCSEEGNIFYIMHEHHNKAQIVRKTNRLIISGVASCVCLLDISPLPHTGRWKVARTRNQGGVQWGEDENAIDIFHVTHWCYSSCQNYNTDWAEINMCSRRSLIVAPVIMTITKGGWTMDRTKGTAFGTQKPFCFSFPKRSINKKTGLLPPVNLVFLKLCNNRFWMGLRPPQHIQ